MFKKSKVYIAGAITNNPEYEKQFKEAQIKLEAQGYIVLNPALLPKGMKEFEYMRICFAMIDVADEIWLLSGWEKSGGANLEMNYCMYCSKPVFEFHSFGRIKKYDIRRNA